MTSTNRTLLARLALVAIGGLAAAALCVPPAAAAPAPDPAPRAAAPASIEIVMTTGATWRGELGDRVEVAFAERGIEQTIVGTVAKVEKLYVVIETVLGGKAADKVIFRSDLRSMRTVAAGEAAPPSRDAAAGPTRTTTAPAAGGAPEKGPDGFLKAPKPGVFFLPMKGTVGIGLRHEELDAIAKEADKYGPGQIIVLEIDSPGGLVIEGDKIHDIFRKWKDRHRFVAWIKEAISGAAFTALHCDEIYFMKVGSLGAITMFAGQTAISGEQLDAWLRKCTEVAEFGGRSGIPVRAMIHAPLLASYSKDPVTGRVTWYESKEGDVVLSDEKDNLVFNASNALDSGFSDGTADTVEELAKLLQLPEWYEINDYGRKIAADWQDAVESAKREVPKIAARLDFKGAAGGTEEKIGTEINLLRDLLRWWDRAPNVMRYELGVPEKDQIERAIRDRQKALADMRRARRGG